MIAEFKRGFVEMLD